MALQGVELETDLIFNQVWLPTMIDQINLHANYAYIDNDTNAFYEHSLHARHSGAAYAIVHYPNGWLSSLAYYGNSAIAGEAFNGWELGLGKSTRLASGDLTVQGKAVYWPDQSDSFTVSETFHVQNINDHPTTFYVTLEYAFR